MEESQADRNMSPTRMAFEALQNHVGIIYPHLTI